jgi:hypothetical protein
MATPVSSHEVSIPKTRIAILNPEEKAFIIPEFVIERTTAGRLATTDKPSNSLGLVFAFTWNKN